MRLAVLLLFGSIAAFAQRFTFGIKAGVPLTDFVHVIQNGFFTYTAPTSRYIIGPTAELNLPFGLSVEFDALYRRLHYDGSGRMAEYFVTNHTTSNNWEFPLLLKYRLHVPVVRPYVDAGVAWDALTGVTENITLEPAPVNTARIADPVNHKTAMGFVLGGGLDIQAIFLHISPEIRFTRWGSQQIYDPSGLLHSNQNQAEFLVGVTF